MKSLPLTAYQRHVRAWESCTRCELHEHRHKVVLFKGRLPCDVLFVGEAPGVSENTIGKPFVGPAGKLLDMIIHNATNHLEIPPRMAFTNLIACIPLDEEGAKKTVTPPFEAIEACGPRVQEAIDLARPKLVVFVGQLAESWLDPKVKGVAKIPKGCAVERIDHPAYILRQNVANQGLMAQTAEVRFRNAVDEMIEKNKLV